MPQKIEFEGFEIEVCRSKQDGSVLIYVDTSEAEEPDNHPNGSPRLRIMVNDEISDSDPEGGWTTDPDQ